MDMTVRGRAVNGLECVADFSAQKFRGAVADDRFKRRVETAALCDFQPWFALRLDAIVENRIFGADDAKAAPVVTERQRDRLLHQRIVFYILIEIAGYITDRTVFQIYRVEYQLVGAAFGADDLWERFGRFRESVMHAERKRGDKYGGGDRQRD